MTTQTTFPKTDLVLRIEGGERDGELIPVNTQKCYLGIKGNSDVYEQLPRCAIYRGPQGATVRSYADEITVNGAGRSVHWLETGDRIEFSHTIAVEVTQLGTVDPGGDDPESVDQESMSQDYYDETNPEVDEPETLATDQSVESEAQAGQTKSRQWDAATTADHEDTEPENPLFEGKSNESAQEVEQPNREASDVELPICETNDSAADLEGLEFAVPEEPDSRSKPNSFGQLNKRLELVESQIREIQRQDGLSQANFEKLNQRLDDLYQQMSRVASLSDSSHVANVELKPAVQRTRSADDKPMESVTSNSDSIEELTFDSAATDQSNIYEDNLSINDEPTADPDTQGGYDSASEFYSYAQDDSEDERIVTFDPESADSTETIEPAENVEITDAASERTGVSPIEIDSRLAEMERIFGGSSSESESVAEPAPPIIEQPLSPTLPREISPTQPFNPKLETSMDISNETSNEYLRAHTADDQPAHTFDNSTHGQNEGADSFAANPKTTDARESFATIPLQHPPVDSTDPGSPEGQSMLDSHAHAEPEETPAETLSTEPTEQHKDAPPKKESVADLLARMQSEGQWSGIPVDDQEIQPAVPVLEPVPVTPEPVDERPLSESNTEDDVEDYMSQLLSRMRGGAPAEAPKPVAQPVKPKEEKPTEEPVITPPTNPLKPEEFVPRRKATKIESFDAMRELANSSARSAVMHSEEGRRKALGYVQVGIAGASFLMSIYYLLIASQGLFDVSFFIGLICLSISGFLGHRYYSTIKQNELLESTGVGASMKQAASGDEPKVESEPLS